MSNTLMQVSHQWATRPDDERFTSIPEILAHYVDQRDHSKATVLSTKQLDVAPASGNTAQGIDFKGLVVAGPDGEPYAPTNWSFRQLCTLARGPQDVGTPSAYLATLPSPLAADCLNYGLKFKRDVEDVGLLTYKNGGLGELRAATGPRYGRVWQAEILQTLQNKLDLTQWRVPGEFGKKVPITKANTTLYGSDRDMFVFLCDEDNRVEVPTRRRMADGTAITGSLARGFWLRNSEVGASKIWMAAFYFDYLCCNRIVWGVEGFREIEIRHTAGAPDRWLEEMQPALLSYANKSTDDLSAAIEEARRTKIETDLNEFLGKRFNLGTRVAQTIQNVHQLEEGKPIETLWDAATGITAYAKSIPHQDARVEVEKVAGEILDLAAERV